MNTNTFVLQQQYIVLKKAIKSIKSTYFERVNPTGMQIIKKATMSIIVKKELDLEA